MQKLAFQFLIGRLVTDAGKVDMHPTKGFQFLIGRLVTLEQVGCS